MSSKPNKIVISLGWRCKSAIRRADVYNLRSPKYKTCPFDIMISNISGIIKCFETDFEYFCDIKYLVYDKDDIEDKKICGEVYIKNTYYNFLFNHETPGHANLHLNEKWPGNNKYHFTKDNFKMFIERYNRRINNLRNYINDNDHIVFILESMKKKDDPLLEELKTVLNNKYPDKKFSFDLLLESNPKAYKIHLKKSGLNEEEIELHM